MFSCSCIIFLLVNYVNCARILGVFPVPSYSHQIVYRTLWTELARQGHDLVVMTPNPIENDSIPNVRQIDWSDSYDFQQNFLGSIETPKNGLSLYSNLWKLTDNTFEHELSHPEVQQLIKNETEHFDLLIMEWYYPTMAAFSERFNCPMIGFTSMPTNLFSYDAIGQPSHPVYTPDFVIPAAKNLNLFHRFISGYLAGWFRFVYRYFVIPNVDVMVRRHFGENMRSVYEIERDISLLFVTTNFVIHPLRPNVPTVVNFHGFHLKPNKPLPETIGNYLDEATEGVIYFSLGSNLRSSSLTEDNVRLMVDCFSELPYKILWKWNGDEFPNKSNNIKFIQWVPQQDVLAHPNVKAFITQGGLQSLEEAIHFKIPIVGLPFYGDQFSNTEMMVYHGLGVRIDFESITKPSFKNAIIEVVTNKKYKENMLKISEVLNDHPMKPLDLAIWWVEYILRNKGAKHLKSPLADTPWYQYYLLDVIALVATALFLAIVTVIKLWRLLLISYNWLFIMESSSSEKSGLHHKIH